MSRELAIIIRDDLTGAPADGVKYIGLDGQWYELDTSEDTRADIGEALGPFIRAGRRVDEVPRTQDRKLDSGRVLKAELRAYAREHGTTLVKAQSGGYRYPAELVQAFAAERGVEYGDLIALIRAPR